MFVAYPWPLQIAHPMYPWLRCKTARKNTRINLPNVWYLTYAHSIYVMRYFPMICGMTVFAVSVAVGDIDNPTTIRWLLRGLPFPRTGGVEASLRWTWTHRDCIGIHQLKVFWYYKNIAYRQFTKYFWRKGDERKSYLNFAIFLRYPKESSFKICHIRFWKVTNQFTLASNLRIIVTV